MTIPRNDIPAAIVEALKCRDRGDAFCYGNICIPNRDILTEVAKMLGALNGQ